MSIIYKTFLLSCCLPFITLAQNGYKGSSGSQSEDQQSEYRCNAKFRLIGSRKSSAQRQEWDNVFAIELKVQNRSTKYVKMKSHYIQATDEFIVGMVGSSNTRRYKDPAKTEEKIILFHLMNTGVIPNWCQSSYSIKSNRSGDRSPRRKIKRRSLISKRRRIPRRRTVRPRRKPVVISRSAGSITSNSSDCSTPLDSRSFQEIRRSVAQQGFDDKKLTAAKIGVRTSCPSRASQIVKLMKLLSFSKNKLAFAKYAYQYAYDKQNYSQVVNALTFSRDKQKLRNFINGR